MDAMGRKDKMHTSEGTSELTMGMRLRYARQSKKVSLTAMADLLKYTKGYLSGVENGNIRVSDDLVQRYRKVLKLDTGELEEIAHLLQRTEEPTKQQIWLVPYQRNRFFTGRETFFETMRSRLVNSKVRPHALAINGLGGIGKTQLVVEYAYRYRTAYAAVLWFNTDSPASLIDSYVNLANELDLPEKGAQDRNITLRVVQRWLKENPHCLIVLDNVEDPAAIYEFIVQMGESHIILTTRAQAIGVAAQTLELGAMDIEESILLLLRRAQIAPAHAQLEDIPETSFTLAQSIALVMGGLPLALNQAASYIEETGCGLAGYLRLIEAQLAKMLKVNDRALIGDHHTSVTATWTLSFEKIKQNNAAAAELLYLCAFLSAEKIYEEFIIESAPALDSVLQTVATDPIELHWAIAELRKYSLLRTDPDSGALSIHRLVQTVIQDTMDEETRRCWAERTIKAVNQAFPQVEVARWHETWSKCQRYYPQADASIALIQQWKFTGNEVSQLLNKTGKYLEERTQFSDAERLYHYAIELDREFYGNLHSKIVKDMSNIALLYERQGKYENAEKKYREALLIYDKIDTKQYDLAIFRNYITLLQKMEREREAEDWKRRVKDMHPEQAPLLGRRTPINDNDERIIYNGDWQTRIHEGDFNSDAHFTNSEGAAFLYPFEGWGIEIISDTSSIRGEIEILIDDVSEETVNTLLTANKLSQTIVFSKTDLPQGTHMLKVVLRRGEFILDALAVFSYEKEDIF
jgi:transcriptional regulator with XRE-family HTH domain/tetratricopeptide (TPR) repeat protein